MDNFVDKLKKKGCEKMETIELFNTGLFYTILGNTILSPEEREMVSLLYHSYLEDREHFEINEEEKKSLLHLYKITIEVLLTNANHLQKVVATFEEK